MISQELQTQNQESETAKEDHNLLDDEDQNLQNHEQTHSEPSNVIEVNKEGARKTGDDWVISVREKLQQARKENTRASPNNLCIYRVPHYLYEKDEKSYSPQTVSIGPYHHGKEHLQAMECHKWRALDMLLQRSVYINPKEARACCEGPNQDSIDDHSINFMEEIEEEALACYEGPNNQHCIEYYMNAMKELEEKARACYEGPINLSSEKFTEMLVLDGCFVLEIFKGTNEDFAWLGYAQNDPIFAIRGMMHSVRSDMLMLENQLPFFVIFRLAELQFLKSPGSKQPMRLTLMKLVAHFFDPLMPTPEPLNDIYQFRNDKFLISKWLAKEEEDNAKELHCLSLFRQTLLVRKHQLSGKTSDDEDKCLVADKRRQRMIRCVTELRDAGFKFRRSDSHDLLDIRFNNGYLEIPKLVLHDGTKPLLLNLISFEQTHNYMSNDVTSYIMFMDNLIDSAEDVRYLHLCGIIDHSLGSDSEVADMINGLCHEVVFNTNDVYLSQLLQEVDRCYKQKYFRKWNTWTRTLKSKYFDNPWAYLSFFAAVILLSLTFAQTYFAAYAYFKPSVP